MLPREDDSAKAEKRGQAKASNSERGNLSFFPPSAPHLENSESNPNECSYRILFYSWAGFFFFFKCCNFRNKCIEGLKVLLGER